MYLNVVMLPNTAAYAIGRRLLRGLSKFYEYPLQCLEEGEQNNSHSKLSSVWTLTVFELGRIYFGNHQIFTFNDKI